jgi:hypothetical protein
MGLMQTQALLARLFTDARLRQAFFESPVATAMDFGLGADEAQTLAGLDRREVADFARSLLGKRALDARKALPATARALGKDFDALLFDAIDGPPGPLRHRADAASLTALLAARAGEPPWLGDLARYEMVFVDAARPGAFFRMRRFDWPVEEIARRLIAGGQVDAVRRRCVGLWARVPGGRLLWRVFVAPQVG